ncbi:hypothetical protein Mycch_1064 [Mycolicibacterium chubuense NBB4]|uniref:Secreted protein n=1 Tax=Mycolicibacterium chubuense (strain NBB4) TaxID=710421 RepID=I4BF17_MYCCN|nr:hypothetical protein [Mycolicibacterium chubuense]AFM15874.1 hypothetical protein Mycch_1064 [Mycolicibacterium chubuense NBB4]
MSFVMKAAAGALLGGSALFTAGLGVANAQPLQTPDGLVNLAVGDVTILKSVSTDQVATAAGALCGTAPQEVGALAQQVDSKGAAQTVCSGLPGGDLVITQNVSSSTEDQPQGAQDSDDGSTAHGGAQGSASSENPQGSNSPGNTPGNAEATSPSHAG